MFRNFIRIILTFFLLLLLASKINCQNATVCNAAQNICTNPILTFTAGSGNGLLPGLGVSNPFTNPQSVNAGCMFSNVPNPQWLVINVTSSGNLGFSFGANGSAFPQAGNYDWIMWPYTSTTCSDIFNNTLPPVSCNWNCTGSGGTGMGTVPVGGSPCNFQPSIPVIQGQQYLILITNPSGVNTNVSFTSTGSAGISCNPLKYPNITACPGQQAIATGTWVGASSGTYTLNPGNIVQSNPSFTISSMVNQVFTVSAQGINSASIPITEQTTFTLSINPNIPIAVSTATNFCYGSNAIFTVNPAGGTYTVTGPGIGATIFTTNAISITNISNTNIGTFSVIANYTNGCVGSLTTAIDVSPNFSISVNTNSSSCEGGTVNLTASLPTATAYTWNGPNSYISVLQNPSINSIQSAASGIYTITANVNYNGIACAQTNTTQIDVVAISTIAITPNYTLCEGSTLNLISSALSAISYSWSGPNTFTSSNQNTAINGVLPINAGNYSITAFFSNGTLTCANTAVTNVSIVPTATINISTPQNICQNATANLSVSALGAVSYNWFGPNAFNSNMTSPSILNIQPSASGIYTAIAVFTMGSVNCSVTGTNQINVVSTNSVLVTPSYTVCEASNLNLTANAALASSYQWNGPNSYTSNTQNPTINSILPIQAGNYTATAFFTNGALTCSTNAVSNIIVVSTPTVNVLYPSNVCQNSTFTLAANAVGAIGYGWSGPNSFTSSLSTPTITSIQLNAAGIYSATALFSVGSLTCSKTITNQINVLGTNTISTPSNYTLCEGSVLSLSANALTANSYSWYGPGGFNSLSQNPTITNILPNGAGNYSVTAFFSNSAITCTTAAVCNVSIVATPPVNVNVPANICQNTTATISAAATGAASYLWNGPNAFSSNLASIAINSIQPIASGIYSVTATYSLGTVSCSKTGTNQLHVIAVNPINVTSTVNGCALQTNILQANSIGAVSYVWNGPNGYVSATTNATLYNTPLSAGGIYTVTCGFGNGLLSCYNSATVNFVVNPVISFTLPTSEFVCYNSPLNLQGPFGATSYTWQNLSGVMSNNQLLTIPNISTSQAGTYSLTASIGFCATTQTIDIIVSTPIQYTLVPTNTTICRGDSITLYVGCSGGTANYAYVWDPSVFLASPNGSVQTLKPTGTTIYNIHGYDIACPTHTISHSFTLNVLQPPIPNLQLDKHEGCEPLCNFYNSKTGPEAVSIIYDFGGNMQIAADRMNYCINEPGHYKLNIITKGANGCSGTFGYSDSIIVYPKPHADFNYVPESPTISNNQVTFNPKYMYGPVVSWTWMFLGTGQVGYDSTTLKSPQRYYDNIGSYPVMLISKTDKGCADTILKMLDVKEDMTIYIPNTFTPNGDNINDSFLVYGIGFSKDNFLMEIFTRLGNQIYSSKNYTIGWDGLIDGKKAEDGAYVYKIKVKGFKTSEYKEYLGHINLIR